MEMVDPSQQKTDKSTRDVASMDTLEYHDYANETEETSTALAAAAGAGGKSGHLEQNFPVKLHYMLSDMQSDGLDHIIAWQPHGRCFIVHKPQAFAEKVLPL